MAGGSGARVSRRPLGGARRRLDFPAPAYRAGPEFVVGNAEDYVERAVALALAPETPRRLAELRRGMRQHLARASICDTTVFARNMEALYAQMVVRGPVVREPS